MITVVTLLRGNKALSARWADAWAHCTKPEDVQLFIGANNEDDVQLGVSLGARVFPMQPFAGGTEQARIQHVARLYEMVLPQVQTEHLLIWEDDILPPTDCIAKMESEIGDAAGVVSVTPFHDGFTPQMAILFYEVGNTACIPVQSLPMSGLDEVYGGGTAFSLWKRDAIVGTLPWDIQIQANGFIPGWDWILAQKLYGNGKTLVDLSIRCYHG